MTTASTEPRHSRPSWPAAMSSAALAALAHPQAWAVALAGFFARGGIVLFVLPVVVLPTPSVLANVFSPILAPVVLGGLSAEFIALVALVVGLLAAWLVLGGVAGAWADVTLAADHALDEELGASVATTPRTDGPVVWRAAVARLVAHLPLAIGLAWLAVRLLTAGYGELVSPFEVVTPLAVRIVRQVPDAILLVLVTWLLGEAAGGLAVRRLVLADARLGAAIRDGWLDLVRRPAASLATLALATAIGVAAIAPTLLAAAVTWGQLRTVILEVRPPEELVLALLLFVAIWLAGLVVAGAGLAWRSSVWSAELSRRMADSRSVAPAPASPPVGTIGGSEAARPGG